MFVSCGVSLTSDLRVQPSVFCAPTTSCDLLSALTVSTVYCPPETQMISNVSTNIYELRPNLHRARI